MAGITQGKPELAVGEPIRLGSNDEFEIEQHPISDRLIIKDTVNGKVAYVRKPNGGQIGGDGVLIQSLKESKPMNDTGRTYDTIQQAERESSTWVFVPPGTYNEVVEIKTDGLDFRGCGYNTHINGRTEGIALSVEADRVSVENLSASTDPTGSDSYAAIDDSEGQDNTFLKNITVRESMDRGFQMATDVVMVNCESRNTNRHGIVASGAGRSIIVGCNVSGVGSNQGIYAGGDGDIIANSIIQGAPEAIQMRKSNQIAIGNRIINCDRGIDVHPESDNCIVANNRISDSTTAIDDSGTGTLLDANLTGASN